MSDPLSLNLVLIAGLFLLGVIGEAFFARTQIPDVVWLIGAGVLLNLSGLIEPDAFDGVLPLFAALTLIIILFEGGSQIKVGQLARSAPRATALSLVGFILTTLFVALLVRGGIAIGMLPETWGWSHGVMIGAMLGGSSSLIVMPSMTLAKVEEKVANLVGLESALTDALCVVVAVAVIDTLAPAAGGSGGAGEAALTLAKSFGIALTIGVAAGWTWMPIMSRLAGSQHGYPVTLAMLMVLYVVVGKAGGSSAMGILAFSVIVGNADTLMKTVLKFMGVKDPGERTLELDYEVRAVHTQISFIIKSFFFTFIGLKLNPPWSAIFAGIIIGIGLLAARAPVVALIARGNEFTARDRSLITVSLPRGMAAGVLATIPLQAGIPDTEDLPSMVFAAVITSIAIFAIGFRKIRSAPEGKSTLLAAKVAEREAEAELTIPVPGGERSPDDPDESVSPPAEVAASGGVPAAASSTPTPTPTPSPTPVPAATPTSEPQAMEPVLPSARPTVALAPGEVPGTDALIDTAAMAGAAPSGFVATNIDGRAENRGPHTLPGVPRPPSPDESEG